MYKFVLVSYLEKDLTNEIISIQEEIAKETNTYDALNSWKPHLTIGSGITIEKKNLEVLYDKINSIIQNHKCFKINIKDYGFVDDGWPGENPNEPNYMINLKVEKNKELLKLVFDIEDMVNSYEKWYKQPDPYQPHITLGYGFSLEKFNKIKKDFNKILSPKEALINNLCLASKDDRGKWNCFKKFTLH